MGIFVGRAYRDILYGTVGNDWIYGRGGNDDLYGLDGNDYLDGGRGYDKMYGGRGNDIYIVDQADVFDYSKQDLIVENADEGTDTIYALVDIFATQPHANYVEPWMPYNVENLKLLNSVKYGVGNGIDNVIEGNDYTNNISGWEGDDTLYGYGGDDILGDAATEYGDDLLDGGAGNDKMYGGQGNDTYWVDSALDKVIELSYSVDWDYDIIPGDNGGTDKVYSSISYVLPDNVENLTLTDTAYGGAGNTLDNVIEGTNNTNFLAGYSGIDSLYGNGGNDTLDGGDNNDTLDGGSGNDILHGGRGNDILIGGTGNDTLYGEGGNDQFRFITRKDGTDVIKSFNTNYDSIGLNAESREAFNQGLSFNSGVLNSSRYFEGAGFNGNGTESSGIYVDTKSGYVWYNPTSSLAGDSYHFATVDLATVVGGISSLSAADFVLI